MSKLYTGFKIFHFNNKIHDLEYGRITAPLHVRLKPVNRCNHSCFYCCYRNKDLFLGENLNEGDIIPGQRLLSLADEMSRAHVRAVTFSGGGEPLCHPTLPDMIEKLSHTGIKTAILTNGSLLDKHRARVIADKCSWIRISMDGVNNEMYIKNRKVKDGEFDKICNNIREFAKIKKADCELGINFIVTHQNYTFIYEFIMLMNSLGADHIKISEAVVSTDVKKNREYLRPFYQEIKEMVKESKKCLDEKHSKMTVIDMIHDVEASDNEYEKAYTWCPFIRCISVIGADLKVYACQDKAYTSSGELGDLTNTSFDDLWLDPEFHKRVAAMNPSIDCCHHCVQNNKNLMLLDYLNTRMDHIEFV